MSDKNLTWEYQPGISIPFHSHAAYNSAGVMISRTAYAHEHTEGDIPHNHIYQEKSKVFFHHQWEVFIGGHLATPIIEWCQRCGSIRLNGVDILEPIPGGCKDG